MRKNRLQLTADFIRAYLRYQQIEIHNIEVGLPLGIRLVVSIDPRTIRIDGRSLVVPLQPNRGPGVELRFHQVGIAGDRLWFTADKVRLGPATLPVGNLVAKILQKALRKRVDLERDGDRFGIDANAMLAPKAGIHLVSVDILNGIDVEFEMAAPESASGATP